MKNIKYTCPCCGYKTLDEKPPGTYDICPICFWEDDPVQYNDPDYEGGANHISLRIAQQNFIDFGACEKRCLEYVRKPNDKDIYEVVKDITNIMRMNIAELIKIFKAMAMPLDKILDLYNGTIEVENSNFIFNREELENYLTWDEMHEYFLISRRKSLKGRYFTEDERENILLNLSDEKAEDKITNIKKKFLKAIDK